MDRQLIERMVGAGILLVVVIVLAPLILDGGGDDRQPNDSADGPTVPLDLRTHTIHLDSEARQPPVPRPLEIPDPLMQEVAPPVSPESAGRGAAGGTDGGGQDVAVAAVPEPVLPSTSGGRALVAEPPPAPTRTPADAPVPATVGAGSWFVQLGAFGERANADRLAADLRRGGFPVVVAPITVGGATRFRVRVGPAVSREEATRLADRLATAGHRGQIVQ